MKILTETLISDLIEITKTNINDVVQLQNASDSELNQRPGEDSWSALECIEHLNRYGDFYLPEIESRLNLASENKTTYFRAGKIGNYFARIMQPDQKPMKTLKPMNPAVKSVVRVDVLQEFINQQKRMLDILDKARSYNLTKIKTAISISKVLKLRLGDTFRVVIYHNQRHIAQAQRSLSS